MPKLNQNALDVPFYLTKRISEGVALEQGTINLSRGQAGFLPPGSIYDSARDAITSNDDALFKYKPAAGDKDLRTAIACWYQKNYHIDVDPSRIAVTVGGTGAITLAFQVFSGLGGQVVIPDPSYPFYMLAARYGMEGREITRIPIGTGKVTAETLAPLVQDNMQLLMLTSPHNPTGIAYDSETLRELVALAQERDFWIGYDENHFPEIYDGIKHLPIHAVDKEQAHSVMLGSVSRLAIQGERVGWAILPQQPGIEDIVQAYVAQSPFANTRGQKLATFVLNHYEELGFDEIFLEYQRKRDVLVPRVNALPGFHGEKPQGTSYFFVDIKDFVEANRENLSAEVTERMRKKGLSPADISLTLEHNSLLAFRYLLHVVGVGTVPGLAYGPASDDFIRFTFSVPESELKEAIQRMERHLR